MGVGGWRQWSWPLLGVCADAITKFEAARLAVEAELKAALEIGVRSRQEAVLMAALAEARKHKMENLLVQTCQTALDQLVLASESLEAELKDALESRSEPRLLAVLERATATNHSSSLVDECGAAHLS